ncbi:MAG TPA: AAA family ATPase [Anaerolineaceae bacterium]|nr:AAA family ATPase [Anaerolineaceae bacterium]
MSTPKLNILLLGPPEVTLDGKPVLIKRRLNRALLFYLAAQKIPVTREEVCSLFWPDEPEDVARKNLREALSRLRTSLGMNDLLISNGEQLSLNPETTWVDYREMDRIITPLINSSEMHNKATLPEWMVAQLKNGIAFCRTNHFMQGTALSRATGFENWLEMNNQAYHFARIKVIDRLIDHYISSGNLEEALVWLGKATEVNPLDEDVNYLTLICLRDTGRMQELIEFATYLEKLYLQQEEPLPERFTKLKNEALAGKEMGKINISNWPGEENIEAPYISREDELETLNRALRRRGVVQVRREAGVGKTRLLKQFFTSQPFAPRLFYCRAHPLGQKVPFYTIAHPLRDQMQDAEWQALNPDDQRLLSHFYHNVFQGPGALRLPVPQGEMLPVMEDVFFAFLNLMKICASRRPLLFILDDTMWMDLASISLVDFLIEKNFFSDYGLLVIATSPEVENPDVDALLQRTSSSRNYETITLEPLQERETSLFVQRAMGKAPGEQLVKEILRLTGGKPYYLLECLRNMKLKKTEIEQMSGLEECTPPESIIAIVKEKINGLSRESVSLLSAAAILGREFQVDVIEEMTGTTGMNLVDCIQELSRAGFIRVNPEDGIIAGYVFKHDVEREIVVGLLGPAARRHLHLRAAAALKKRRKIRPHNLIDIATHFDAAGEVEKAVAAWLEAGRYARSQYSKENTYTAYGRALKLICNSPSGFNELLIYEVVNEWGNYAVEHDDGVTGENIYNCCLKTADAHRSPFLAGTGYNGLGRVFELHNDFQKAEECLKKAEFYLAKTDHQVEKNRTLARLGNIHFGKDEYTQAIDYLDRALNTEPLEIDAAWLDNRVNILTYLCATLCLTGEPERAHALGVEMVKDSIMVNRRSAYLQALAVHSMTQFYSGRVDEAIQTCVTAKQLAEKLDIRYWRSVIDLVLAQAYLFQGNLDKCWFHLNQAARREVAFPQEKLSMHAQLIKGEVYRCLRASEKADAMYTGLIDSGEKNYQTIISRHLLGSVQYYEGKPDEALLLIEEGIKEASIKGLCGVALEAEMTKLMLTFAGGSVVKLKEVGGRILVEMNKRGMLNREAYAGWITAVVAELEGRTQDALERYSETQSSLAASKNVWAEFQVLGRMFVLSKGSGEIGRNARKRVDELMAALAQTATLPEVKGLFISFRKKWRINVNDMSTPLLYIHRHQ